MEELLHKLDLLKENLNKVIIGKGKQIEYIIAALIAEGHVLLEDLPGTGKTLLAKSLAKSLKGSFSRIQFTPDLLPNDIIGIHYYNQKSQDFQWRQGPIHANIVLADELNRTTPRSQSALLEAMAEKQVTVDGKLIKLPYPFFVVATQNPIETEGTFPLPEAQLDRFLIKLSLGYPTEEEEINIIFRYIEDNPLDNLEAVISAEEIMELQKEVKKIHLEEELAQYITKGLAMMRNHSEIEVGPSSRAALALVRFSQSLALLRGRQFVIPEDIQEAVLPVLEHRIILGMNTSLQKMTKDVLEEIMEKVPVPLEDIG